MCEFKLFTKDTHQYLGSYDSYEEAKREAIELKRDFGGTYEIEAVEHCYVDATDYEEDVPSYLWGY
jgi:hypothetical protein